MRITASMLMGLLFIAHLPCNKGWGQQHNANTHAQLEDPIFGVSYNYTKVRYEQVPTSVRQICANFEKGTYWTFAHAHRNSGDYYVVMGVVPGQDGDPLGAALWIKDSKCYEEDSTWILSGFIPADGYSSKSDLSELPGLKAPKVCDRGPLGECHYILRSPEEESILRDLVRDAISRGEQAWGGNEDRFKKEACRPSLQQENSSMPIVQQELTKFCTGPK